MLRDHSNFVRVKTQIQGMQDPTAAWNSEKGFEMYGVVPHHGGNTVTALHIELWKLLAPFLLLALPALAVVAALAVLFEAIPFLRGGLGNIVYLCVWIAGLSLPLAANAHALDLLGMFVVADSAINAAHLSFQNSGFQFALGYFDYPVSTFRWEGITWTAEMVISRVTWLGFSLALVALSAILFDRFDPSRGRLPRERQKITPIGCRNDIALPLRLLLSP